MPLAVDYQKSLTDGLSSFATFVPRFLGFLVVLLVGYLVAKVVTKLVDKVLERVGFDRAVEKGGVRKALSKSEYDASDIVAKVAGFAVFVVFLSAAVSILGIPALERPMAQFIALLPNIVVALVLVVLGLALATAVKSLIEDTLGGLSYGSLVANAAAALIAFGFVKAALDQVGIATDVTGPLFVALLATAGGIAVVGVGGGLVKPMQQRWEDALSKAGQEKETVKARVQARNAVVSEPQTSVYPTEPPLPLTTPQSAPARRPY